MIWQLSEVTSEVGAGHEKAGINLATGDAPDARAIEVHADHSSRKIAVRAVEQTLYRSGHVGG